LTRIAALLATLLIGVASAGYVWSSDPADTRFSGVEKIVVFGDVHGAAGTLVELLTYLELIDPQQVWTGGTTHLVSLGDLLDRGEDSRLAMDLLMDLQAQALQVGGRVHVVLGNHEVMNLTGDLRYVADGEFRAFAANEPAASRSNLLAVENPQAAHGDDAAPTYPAGFFAQRSAFASDGHYGRWLLDLPAMVVINDIAFVHGGFPFWMNEFSQVAVNREVGDSLHTLLLEGSQLVAAGAIPPWEDLLSVPMDNVDNPAFSNAQHSPFLGNSGPFWYRGTAHCHPLIEEHRISTALDHFGVKRLVLGHSPTTTRRIQQRLQGRVILADTGMLASYYRGQPAAVVFQGNLIQAVYPNSETTTSRIEAPPSDLNVEPADETLLDFARTVELPDRADGQPFTVAIDGRARQVLFRRGNKRSNSARVAAYRLDRMLGLGMIPPTVRHAGGRGTVSLLPAKTLTETERQADKLHRPNWCAPLTDYQLMYAFDALIRTGNRTPDSMLYDLGNWALLLLPPDGGFGTSTSLPEHRSQIPRVLPRGMANVLATLSRETLDQALLGLLSERQIRSIETRGRSILSNWEIED
jgi:hypothetical protein